MSSKIVVPGAFHCYLDGTGAVQGDIYSRDPEIERGAQELRDAYRNARRVRRGYGYSLRLDLPSPEAVQVLREYAESCVESILFGDPDAAELRAARAVITRCEQALVS